MFLSFNEYRLDKYFSSRKEFFIFCILHAPIEVRYDWLCIEDIKGDPVKIAEWKKDIIEELTLGFYHEDQVAAINIIQLEKW